MTAPDAIAAIRERWPYPTWAEYGAEDAGNTVAHAPADIAYLLAEVDRLREALAQCQKNSQTE